MTTQRVEVRPATREDLQSFYGKDSIGPTFKGYVGIVDGEIAGVGGLAYRGGLVCLFLDIKPEAKRFKVSLHRMARQVLKEARQRHRVVFAEADDSEPGAVRWLRALGFEHHEGRIWRVLGQSLAS